MWRYTFTDEGRNWMKLPKDSLEEYSKFRSYKEAILNLLLETEKPLSIKEISKMTGIKGDAVDHIVKSYYYAGYLCRIRTLL